MGLLLNNFSIMGATLIIITPACNISKTKLIGNMGHFPVKNNVFDSNF
jgi:hypothetical protein